MSKFPYPEYKDHPFVVKVMAMPLDKLEVYAQELTTQFNNMVERGDIERSEPIEEMANVAWDIYYWRDWAQQEYGDRPPC